MVWGDDHQTNTVGRDELVATRVVDCPLDAAVHPTDCQLVGLVEVAIRFLVLELAVLEDHSRVGPVRVDGQCDTATRPAWITPQPAEAVLAECGLPQYLVTDVDDVVLVSVSPDHSAATPLPKFRPGT